MKLRDHYDWVVLGDHPSALLSGCLIARLGLSVLFVDFFQAKTFHVSKEGQAFDAESNFLLGLEKVDGTQGNQPLLAKCLGRLDLSPAEAELFRPGRGLPQILTHDYRLQLSKDLQVMASEWVREI